MTLGKERLLSFEGDRKMWRAKERRGYSHLKKEALDNKMWRARFGRGLNLS
jgi:hypothetical protein